MYILISLKDKTAQTQNSLTKTNLLKAEFSKKKVSR
jgi:hypothetical protein